MKTFMEFVVVLALALVLFIGGVTFANNYSTETDVISYTKGYMDARADQKAGNVDNLIAQGKEAIVNVFDIN